MTFLNRMGVAVANFVVPLTGAGPTNFGGRGKRKCHIPHLPLTLGQYGAAVAVTCGPTLGDLIANAPLFGVCNSAFFKTGRAPNSRYAVCLIDYEWTDETDGRPGSADSKEARSLTTHD